MYGLYACTSFMHPAPCVLVFHNDSSYKSDRMTHWMNKMSFHLPACISPGSGWWFSHWMNSG